MKLEWTIQYGRLVADRFESMARNVKYVIEPDEKGWGAKAIRVRDGMKRIDHTPTRMPLQELVEWCEEDAERPPQPIEPDAPAAETAMKMSGKASKFPSTMDASVWASRCTAWFGAFKVPPQEELAPWFDAAILCGLRAGHKAWLCEAESRSPSPPAPEKLERLKEYFRTPGNRVNITPEERDAIMDGRGWPDPSPPAPEPPGIEERLAALEAIQKAVGRFWAGERLSDMNFVLGRLEKLEARTMGISAELPMWGRRIEELERAATVSAEANHLFHRAIEGRVFNLEART